MAKPLVPNDLVTLDELALSNMWETSALVELLERKGILTQQGVLDMIQPLCDVSNPSQFQVFRPPHWGQDKRSRVGST